MLGRTGFVRMVWGDALLRLGAFVAIGSLRGLQFAEARWLEGVFGWSWQSLRIAAAGIVSAAVQITIRRR
jgi:hypothetical protein